MSRDKKTYIAIDLKSFYASVECLERGLNPLTTNLVVADAERTEKTICLAVSPSLRSYGVPSRPRLFEVIRLVNAANAQRQRQAAIKDFSDKSWDNNILQRKKDYALDYLVAKPRMALYMDYSTRVYAVYLKYIAPEDIHVYSIDEVFIDASGYLESYKMTAHELAMTIIKDLLKTTGITASVGIGSNLYLAKVAMDIVAKRSRPDQDGVRIAELDEMSYRRELWEHRPLTDFWRIGKGYAKRLAGIGLYTMGDIARCSLGKTHDYYNEDILYKILGINAELVIDHAWGWEPCTIADIKAYKPDTKSVGSGQVLHEPYSSERARLVVREMIDLLVLDLVDKGLVTDQLVLTIHYDRQSLEDPKIRKLYKGSITTDAYGREIPKHIQGTTNLVQPNSSTQLLAEAMVELYDRIIDPSLLVRKINMAANRVLERQDFIDNFIYEQPNLFTDPQDLEEKKEALKKEREAQKAILAIQKKYGKNSLLKGMNLAEGATAKDKNKRIGGHKA